MQNYIKVNTITYESLLQQTILLSWPKIGLTAGVHVLDAELHTLVSDLRKQLYFQSLLKSVKTFSMFSCYK